MRTVISKAYSTNVNGIIKLLSMNYFMARRDDNVL